jgi:formate hydrogenlyase subunit 6/NADH:ubiquinone oxidoreductase subunit I
MDNWALPTIDQERCTGCGLCVEYCPSHAVELVACRPVITAPERCAYCGTCEETCPAGAIALAYEIVPSVDPDLDAGPGEPDLADRRE